VCFGISRWFLTNILAKNIFAHSLPTAETRTPLNVRSVRISYLYFITSILRVNIVFSYFLCFYFAFSLFGLFGYYNIYIIYVKYTPLGSKKPALGGLFAEKEN